MPYSLLRERLFFKLLWLILFFFAVKHVYAKALTLHLQNTYLPQAIEVIAKSIPLNVVVSPLVQGEVTIYFDHAEPLDALKMLLASHRLSTLRIGNIWYIAPRDEFIKQKKEELNLIKAKEDVASLVTKIWQLRYAKASDLAHLFQNERNLFLSKRGHIIFDPRTNSLGIQDIPSNIILFAHMIKRLDIPVNQIVILVRLVSIDYDAECELGITFTEHVFDDKTSHRDSHNSSQSLGRLSLAMVKLADISLLDVKLSALEKNGRAFLISSPSLFTVNRELAFIEAGEEVPYQEVSESGGTALVFKKAVLGLKVLPEVMPHDKVLLKLQINQDRPSNRMVLGMPTISTRQIKTSVLVRNGATIVLGGIYETNREDSMQRTPWVSELPIVGAFFKAHSKILNKRELLIFVTPKIIA